MKLKAEYPCGFKCEMTGITLLNFFSFIGLTENSGTKWDCPLHGKKCYKGVE